MDNLQTLIGERIAKQRKQLRISQTELAEQLGKSLRTVQTDPDKQQIVQNIVAYAHPRSMQIIAEGVETAAELRKVIELGADALQGYFLAKPAAVPAKMAPAARKVIAEYSSASDSG